LKDYFKKHFWKKEFYLAQWGLVCPFVAFGVLGSFVYKLFLPTGFFYWFLVALSAMTSVLFFILLSRHFKCCLGGEKGKENWECANN
jgi:Kef-type K+ transport system membrane component KefB